MNVLFDRVTFIFKTYKQVCVLICLCITSRYINRVTREIQSATYLHFGVNRLNKYKPINCRWTLRRRSLLANAIKKRAIQHGKQSELSIKRETATAVSFKFRAKSRAFNIKRNSSPVVFIFFVAVVVVVVVERLQLIPARSETTVYR